MTTYAVTLPLAPSVNRTYMVRWNRGPGSKGLTLTAEARAWKAEAGLRIAACHWKRDPAATAAHVTITQFSSAPKDIDGGVKLILDLVFDHLGLDDAIVTQLTVSKAVAPKAEHRAEVTVTLE